MGQEEAERMYTTNEVAEKMRVTRRTVYDWIKTGHLESVKVGPKIWLTSHAELLRLGLGRVQARKEEPAPAPKPATLAASIQPSNRGSDRTTPPPPAPVAAKPALVPMQQPKKKGRR